MGIAEIIAFFKAVPQIVAVLGEVVSSLKQLRQDAIDKELETVRKEVDVQIQNLILAGNDEQRKKALLELSRAIGR